MQEGEGCRKGKRAGNAGGRGPEGRSSTAAKKTSSNAKCLPFPRITSPAAVLRAQRHVDHSITTLRHRLSYARVDLVRAADDSPCVLELELTEPSLFFAQAPGSADRFVAALARRLGAPISRRGDDDAEALAHDAAGPGADATATAGAAP